MIKARKIETNEGIQGGPTVETYNLFSRNMRDKGWDNIDSILKAGITEGDVLEIGPGPGYMGLEWLKQSAGSSLTGCEISPDMIEMAMRNAKEYGLDEDTRYVQGNCMDMPFDNETFDGVFSNGSLHEWEEPVKAFNEICRVLKPGGAFCITDMRRDASSFLKWIFYLFAKPREIRPGYLSSFDASYTAGEINELLSKSEIKNFSVEKDFFGLCIMGSKK
jgi:ubiquinone/menaquinone biosynthesis C-methylase UbiE